MKAQYENELRRITYDCRKATYLIEKQQLVKISANEQIELSQHLETCLICRIFQRQSITINKMMKDIFHAEQQKIQILDDRFKKSLQEKIEARLV